MSNIQQNQYPKVSVATQQGAVLIVVLLFLVLIILAGVIAVRQSTTDLRLATSDQINALLLQSADNANQNIEQSMNGSSDTDIYNDMLSRIGPFGHFMLNPDSRDHEYIFCFRPRGRFFDINKTSIITPSGSLTNQGYCSPSKADDYISARNASMTQVSVALTPNSEVSEAFGSYTIGQDSNEISSRAFTFDINSTAVLPAYADTKLGSKNCFAQTSRLQSVNDEKDTIGGCMSKAGVPNVMIYEMVSIENQSKGTKCVNFGKGKGKESDMLCSLIPN